MGVRRRGEECFPIPRAGCHLVLGGVAIYEIADLGDPRGGVSGFRERKEVEKSVGIRYKGIWPIHIRVLSVPDHNYYPSWLQYPGELLCRSFMYSIRAPMESLTESA